jgi:predicted transposase YbfD/YdcC
MLLISILRVLRRIKDFRVLGRTKHSLLVILVVVFLGVLAGKKSWQGMHDYAVSNRASIERLPRMKEPLQIPSVYTLSRVFSKLDSKVISEELLRLSKELIRRSHGRGPGRLPNGVTPDVAAFDGKTIRNAIIPGADKSKARVVHAVICDVPDYYLKVEDKENEIVTFPKMIDMLNRWGLIRSRCVTIDAMGCQTSLAAQAISCGADYLFFLKGNQPTTHDQVESLFRDGPGLYPDDIKVGTARSPEVRVRKHFESKRISHLKITPGVVEGWLATSARWSGSRSVGMIETFRRDSLDEVPRLVETRYFISSLDLPTSQMLEVSIAHWRVETMHQILDDRRSFDEDRCGIHLGNSPQNVSLFKKLAIAVIGPYCRLHGAAYGEVLGLCAENFTFLEALLTAKPRDVGSPKEWREWSGRRAAPKYVPNMLAA